MVKMKSLKQQHEEKAAQKAASRGPKTPSMLPYSPEVQLVIARIGSSHKLELLPYVDVGQNYSGSACHMNVKHFVSVKGGRRVHGWVIWQYPNDYAEAEFHSVWEDEAGNLVNVTPHRNGQREIAFIPDSRFKIVRDPATGLDIMYSGVSSAVYPTPHYTLAGRPISSPQYSIEVEVGSELAAAMAAYGVSDLT